jgi:hypothetical protein
MPRSLPQPLAPGFEVRRAVPADVRAIVDLIAADEIGATRDGGDLAPYERAFEAIDADPAQLLVVLTNDEAVVGTLQLTFIPGLARRGGPELHPDQVEAAGRLGDALGRAHGADVRVAPKGAGYKVTLAFESLDEAMAMAERLGAVEHA